MIDGTIARKLGTESEFGSKFDTIADIVFVVEKQFVSVHTVANKITGLLVFLLPLTMAVVELHYSALVVCMVATFAAIQEGHIIRIGKVE